MLKTAPLLLAAALVCFASTGCEKKKSAAELKAALEKAKKEERKVKAAQFYEELIKKYPDSEYVEDAKKRRQAIGLVATPAAKATPKK